MEEESIKNELFNSVLGSKILLLFIFWILIYIKISREEYNIS